jgi:hypothetical protein
MKESNHWTDRGKMKLAMRLLIFMPVFNHVLEVAG